MRSLLWALAVATAAATSGPKDLDGYSFDAYAVEFGKTYGVERAPRKAIFEDNLKKIHAHNRAYRAGNHTWFMSVNMFADLTVLEFRQFQKKRNGPAWGLQH